MFAALKDLAEALAADTSIADESRKAALKLLDAIEARRLEDAEDDAALIAHANSMGR